VFVQTTEDGEWVNLTRASALKVVPHANPNKKGWVVLAFYSGRVQTLGTFPTKGEGEVWLKETLAFADLIASVWNEGD
jgi:hypothetical protein